MRRLNGLLVALALWLAAGPVLAAPAMWVVHKGDARLVLFGSVHLLSPRMSWQSPELEAEYTKAQTVWFEIPFDAGSRADASRAASGQGLLPEGQTLRSQMTDSDRARLERIAPTLGLDVRTLDRMQPWLAEVMLSTAQATRSGARESLGVESQLQKLIPETVERRAFETPAEQIGFFSGSQLTDQLASLAESLRQIEEEPDSFAQIEDAWIAGDVAALIDKAVTPLKQQAPDFYDRLVTKRNKRWVKVIQRLLKQHERAFIVVGVGHLVGPGGVPALLRAKGIRVEGP